MKLKIIPTAGLLIVLTSVCFAQRDDLYVSILLVVSEHSRDSHSTTTSFVIRGQRVVYEETYSGYRQNGRLPIHKEYVFTKEEIAKVKELIQQRDLLKSRSFVITPADAPYTSYELNEEIRWKGKQALINVSGPQKALAEAETRNRRVYEDTNALLEYVRDTVKKRGEAQ